MMIIINKSIANSQVPDLFKVARIIPLYKKNAADNCGNYRPVSLLSALSKIQEKVICEQMMEYFERNILLCSTQYGFRSKSQTTHVVPNMLNHVVENAANKQPVIATYIDLSKAIDCLQYDQLFVKMKHLGFAKPSVNWFRNYLFHRKQLTEVNGCLTDKQDMLLGVPQGSILGPILFQIYINDINRCTDICHFPKFADDTTMLTTGENLDEAVNQMNRALAKVAIWFKRKKLNLNPSKTRYMVFNGKTTGTKLVKIGDEYLKRVWKDGKEKSFKLVGIHVDEGLQWEYHINAMGKKINSVIYSLAKTCRTLEEKSKKLLYSGLIHSHLVYGLPIWGFAKKGRLQSLKVKQKRAIRKIFNLPFRAHTHEAFTKAKILKLQDLIGHTTLCYIQSGLAEKSPIHIQQL